MASTRGRLLVLGVDPFAEVRCTGFADGDCLWDLSLQRTGDDKLEGDVFGEVVDLFFLGRRGRGRVAPGCVLLRSFRRTAGCKQPFFGVIYYMLRSGDVCDMSTWGTALQPVRGVGSGSRDVDDWTQTTLYAEDRGPPRPMTLEHPRCGFAASGLIPSPKDSDRYVSPYPNGPH
jgi:hypothetical protein